MIIGLDPGLDGGCTVIVADRRLFVCAMPVIGTGRREYDETAMRRWLEDPTGGWIGGGVRITNAFIEKQQPMPKNGSQAAFSQGVGYALWRGMLTAMRIPYECVPAKAWQKEMLVGIPGDDTKQRSIVAAQRAWPVIDWRKSTRCTTAHDGMTDSALIAEYGRRQLLARGVL